MTPSSAVLMGEAYRFAARRGTRPGTDRDGGETARQIAWN